ncbi:hypothetical protein ACH0R4_RS21580 [Bacillus cytotoxicus]|uniref:hypothetical protein n=1 Tax=Bacillus cereus group sp. BfR-BA-01492 TaxID=2920361 RepID=UPI001F58EA37|nr:hypothetical protein [Bacillus cereus group sp. BfR-BA-01492]EMA6345221.1 hypothetical protein [Bacillus cytotoxicus]
MDGRIGLIAGYGFTQRIEYVKLLVEDEIGVLFSIGELVQVGLCVAMEQNHATSISGH